MFVAVHCIVNTAAVPLHMYLLCVKVGYHNIGYEWCTCFIHCCLD